MKGERYGKDEHNWAKHKPMRDRSIEIPTCETHGYAACPLCLKEVAGCSPPLTDLSPEDAIRRGRGGDTEGWIEECNSLRESVKVKDALLKKAIADFESVGAQCAESLALNVRLENRVALAEKVLEAAKIMHNPEHWKRNIYCPVCIALNVYYTTGQILYGPGGE